MIKIGAACKWLNPLGENEPLCNTRSTTVRKTSSLDPVQRHEWLWEITKHNLAALWQQLQHVGKLPIHRRMWRLTSDLLPVATHPIAADFYSDPDVNNWINAQLLKCGEFARSRKLRLSFHPAQFVVLGSQNPNVREKSIIELQYQCDLFTKMGYTGWHPDGLAVNIHVGVRDAQISEMRKLLTSSTNVANFVTLENDEYSWNAGEILDTFGDLVPLVLDVHHYWIFNQVRLDPRDALVNRIRESWKGIQPKLHLSMSEPEYCNTAAHEAVDLPQLLAGGITKAKLRAHSQMAWNTNVIEYAAEFGFDIMWEGKDKNLGADIIERQLQMNICHNPQAESIE